MPEFVETFTKLTGHAPFPWQTALYDHWFSVGKIPPACNLPTGLGKTSVIAIWLIALANFPEKMPRRLVYVVNRRTVVDQTTDEVEKCQRPLAHRAPPTCSILLDLADALAKLGSSSEDCPLAVSTLRGQFADNREWSADPSRPAVICGTVDMIGSRLLFSGYGVGFKGKPLHAGFLGQDALLIHDEAHLEPAFQKLIEAIETEQGQCNDARKLLVMELTATSRGDGETFPNDEERKANEADATVKLRMTAAKKLHFHPLADAKKPQKELIEKALAFRDSGKAILVFTYTVEAVLAVQDALEKAKLPVKTLTGTMRGYERDELAEDKTFARFLPKPPENATEKTVYLVCTSAGEVGVNISADHLICDLSTFESMTQRLGRVNRFGTFPGCEIHVYYPTDWDDKHSLTAPRKKTLDLLKPLEGSNANSKTLGELPFDSRFAAFAPEPVILPVTDILFDAWALTTIKDKLPGRPPVEPYLHGLPTEWQPPDTQVAWREEVSALNIKPWIEWSQKEFEKFAFELLDDYPLKPHEILKDNSKRVFERLKKLKAPPEIPVWIQSQDGAVKLTTLGVVVDGDSDDLNYLTVILPPEAGGLNEQGMLDEKSAIPVKDVADEHYLKDKSGEKVQQRVRKWEAKPNKMKLVQDIEFRTSEDEDAAPSKIWYWFVRPTFADPDANASREYGLQPHLDDAKAAAEQFVKVLVPDEKLRGAIALAAGFHDLGKDRRRWQRGIGNAEYPTKKLAKSGNRRAAPERSSYRHEFGSLLDVADRDEFKNLDPDMKELVLHLIAAHHGRARPHFPANEAFDDNYSEDRALALANEVPRRFARLQRKYGRWGLAYLESLVRAADILASKKAEGSDS